MVNTVKFSEFDVADINDSTTENVGLSSGVNTREDKFYRWTSAGRPTSPFNGLLGLNTTLQQYEFWDSIAAAWTQFSDTNFFAILASHAAGEGASLIGLQDQSNVTSKFVQDLANATFIAQTNNGSLQNAQFLGSLTTGIVKNTTVTGVLSISAPLTSIDSLTTVLGDTLYVSAPNTYVNLAGNITSTKQFLSQTGTGAVSAAPVWSTVNAGDIVSPAALTKTDDTNITLTLGGSPTVALLAATSLTLGWTGTLSGARGGTGINNGSNTATYAGNLNFAAAFSTSGAFAVTQTYTGITNVTFPTTGTLATTSQIPTGAALTKTDDTNVTLSLGGSPTVALLAAASLTLGWTGTLSGTRGGTGVNNGSSTITTAGNLNFAAAFSTSGAFAVTQTYTGITNVTFPTTGTLATTSQLATPSALTKTDDTNVTLTLGGSPTVALLAATSLTLGWTGQLSVARGGTGLASTTAYAVLCGGTTSTAPLQSIASVGTSGQVLTSNGAGALPTFQASTGTGTVSSGSINQLAWYAANGTTISGLSTANSGVLITSAGGVPSISSTLPSGIAASGMLLTSPRITTALLDTNGVNWIAEIATASAVNYITVANQIAGSSPSIGATGGDTNIKLVLNGKGTSGVAVQGSSDGVSAVAGYVGEQKSSIVSSGAPVALTNNTNANVTSLALTAGNWMVFGNITFVNPTGTNSYAVGWVNNASATGVDASLNVQNVGFGTSGNCGFTVPMRIFNSGSSSTVYLSTISGFTGNLSACGGLYAIRLP